MIETSNLDERTLLVDARTAARRLGVSEKTLERLAAGGRAPRPRRLGRCRRWAVSELDQWVSAGCGPIDARRETGK